MKRTFVLCIASLLLLGFATLVASLESSDDIMSFCNIKKESDATLVECLKKGNADIEKARLADPRNNNLIQMSLSENMKCFPAEKKEKKHCYIKVLTNGLLRNKLFSANYISLFLWFRRNTYAVLSACAMTKVNSNGVFSCIENIEKEASELIRSDGKSREEAYTDMVTLVNKAIYCYGGVTATQSQCLLQQTEVLKTKFATEISQQRQEMKEKLNSCQISDTVITNMIKCIEPLDAKLIDSSFQMLTNPALASSVLKLWKEKKLCSVLFPEVKTCLSSVLSKRMGILNGIQSCKSSINLFHFDAVTRDIMQYINRTSITNLKLCSISMKTHPMVYKCLGDKFKENPGVLSKDTKTAFIAMMKLVNVSAKCFENVSTSEKMCLYRHKQSMQKTLGIRAKLAVMTGFHILGECNATEKMNACVKEKIIELMTMGKSLLTDPLTAEKIYDMGSSLKTCLNDDLTIKKCVLNKVMTAPTMDDKKGLETGHLFRADEVTRDVIKYITGISSAMLKACYVTSKTEPNVFICLGEKYNENKEVLSNDPKTAFIAMLKLVNESAKCFEGVSKTRKMCLYKRREEMKSRLHLNGKMSAKTAFHILDVCNATPKMKTCVRVKVDELMALAKTMLTDPSIAGKLFDLLNNLKTCLDEDINIRKCVLEKNLEPQPKWYGKGLNACPFGRCNNPKKMKEGLKAKLMATLADCQVTDEKAEEVFNCLEEKHADMKNLLTKNYKQTMFNGMTFMKTFNKCIEDLTDANKLCLSNKKNEMMTEKTKWMEELFDKFLSTCEATESSKPELFKCLEPKRKEMKTLLSQIFDKTTVLPQLMKLAKSMKKCFDTEPTIRTCVKKNAMNYYMSKFGKHISRNSMVDMYCRINDAFKKCQVNVETEPELYDCMEITIRKIIAIFSKKDIDAAAVMQELRKMKGVAMHCLAYTDEETQTCLKKGSESFQSQLFNFRNAAHGFNPKAMMEQTDKMLAKCNITVEKSPILKKCLDNITLTVMEIKPWLPMTDTRREQLKLEGSKYWKCFTDTHKEHKKCMVEMVDSFSKGGSSYYDKFIDSVASKCKQCSKDQCFQNYVKDATKIYKEYMKAVMAKKEFESILEQFRITVVKASLCLKKVPMMETIRTFACLASIKTATFKLLEIGAKMGTQSGLLIRKRRDADDDDDDVFPPVAAADDDDDDDDDDDEDDDDDLDDFDFDDSDLGDFDLDFDFDFDDFGRTDTSVPLFTFMTANEVGSGQQSAATVFKIIYTDKSIDRVNTMFNMMKMFLSTCTNWAPPPEAMRSRQTKRNLPESRKIIDHSGLSRDLFDDPEPVPKLDDIFIRCQKMYNDINSFINNGEEQEKYLKEEDEDHHKRSISKSAAIGGTVGAVIVSAVIVPIFVIFCAMKNSRCSRKKSSSPCTLSCRPSAPIPSIYSTMSSKQQPGSEMPPSYHESLEEGNIHKSVAGLSQILDSSTGESTEKSC